MKILMVGYTPAWKRAVQDCLPEEADVTIKGNSVMAFFAQEETPFDLYVFGNRVGDERDVAVQMLKEAVGVDDHTPTIVFSEEVDDTATARIIELGATLIRSDLPDAIEQLQRAVREQLKLI